MSDSSSQLSPSNDLPTEIDSPDPAPERESQRLRYFELVLVLFVALAGSVVVSIYTVISGVSLFGSNPPPALNFVGVVQEVAALGVLFYVLFRQGRNARDLGLTFNWKDLPLSLGLAVVALIAEVVAWQLLYSGYSLVTGHILDTTQKNVEFLTSSFSIWTLILVVINPFFEELIVRAYLISEVQSLTGSALVAVVLSVVLQATYHLYQGAASFVPYAAMFAVFSLYYVQNRRILPVILAHFYFDLLAVIYFWWR
jgi:membrane protease YdiL (CAAX protease family)